MTYSNKEPNQLKYLSSYTLEVQNKIRTMVEQDALGLFLLKKHPKTHSISNDKMLREYVMDLKNTHLRKSSPLSKVIYDKKIHAVNNALGLHTFISRVQGNKLKSKNEIRISEIFKTGPEAFLEMIVVHELAHIRIKPHDKAFYQLCQYMLPDYHQLEFEMRVYLTQLELKGDIYFK
jgi:predicted metal-dependent hydrolase